MTGSARYVPWIVVGLGVFYLLVAMTPSSDPPGQMQLSRFGALPIIDRGRVKPIDTYARIQLMLISNRQEYTDEKGNRGQPATRWLLNLFAEGITGWNNAVVITDPQVRKWFGLPEKRMVFGVNQVLAAVRERQQELERILKLPAGQRKPLEEKVLRVVAEGYQQDKVLREIAKAQEKQGDPETTRVFRIENDQVLRMLKLEPREGLRYALAEFAGDPKRKPGFAVFVTRAKKANDRDEKQRDLVDVKVMELYNHLGIHERLTKLGGVLLVPPTKGSSQWMTLGEALQTGAARTNPAVDSLHRIILAYARGDTEEFNKEVDAYEKKMATSMPAETASARLEVWFNNFAPFYQCLVLYVVAFLLACLSWVCWQEPLRRSAFWLALVVVVIHTLALALRMYIQARPPVTNLYSSAVFIGWGCVMLCLFIEYLFHNGFGVAGGAVLGFATLIIAHHLGGSGDTLEMMQAVLDTNFWLATHVVAVTTGYTATFVAGLFGIIFVILGVFTTALDQKLRKTLAQIIYGIVCFATLLSFVGTVLGGIWADQSWGRFWGWDPKENGALLIVIMNALILHARWAGLIKDRGMAVLAMVGNMVTMWSWFGTNQLGIGLHAYGFNKTLVLLCRWFWVSQLLLIGVGLLPLKYWRSFQTPAVLPKQPPARPAPRPGRKGSKGIVPAN
jgi:ABC-type transport system involved in cytochrome c biogenesis permease subunit